MVTKKEYTKYFFLLLFLLVIYLSWIVVKPFIGAILSGTVLAYVFYPLYKWLKKRIKHENLAALIIALFIIVAAVLPVVFLFQSTAEEAQYLYIRAKQKVVSGNILGLTCEGQTNLACRVQNSVQSLIGNPQVNLYLQDTIGKGTTFILGRVSDFLLSLPVVALNIFVAFFIMFYLFKQGDLLMQRVKSWMPLTKYHQDHIFKALKEIMFAVVYGSVIVAIIQGVLGGLGFLIFGVASPIAWGLIMIIFAFVPFLGTAFVWGPAAIALIIIGLAENNTLTLWRGIGLFLWGVLIVGTSDNLLKPYIIGERAQIHPVLVLLGVLGGLVVFGFIGLLIGPIILALFMTFIHLYERERKNT